MSFVIIEMVDRDKLQEGLILAKYPLRINWEMDAVLMGCNARRPTRRSASTARRGQRSRAPIRAVGVAVESCQDGAFAPVSAVPEPKHDQQTPRKFYDPKTDTAGQ